MDEISLHVLVEGTRIKTLPSRLGVAELARLAAGGARPASPTPLPTGDRAVIEVDRTVNATGLVGLAGRQFGVGSQLAGQRITLRMEGPMMAVIGSDGTLLRTMACPVPAPSRYRLRGAHRAGILPPPPGGPVTVQRTVSSRGGVMVATPKVQAGVVHAGRIVTVVAEDGQFRLVIGDEAVTVVPHHHQGDPPVQACKPQASSAPRRRRRRCHAAVTARCAGPRAQKEAASPPLTLLARRAGYGAAPPAPGLRIALRATARRGCP